MAHAFLDAVEAFQRTFLDALTKPEEDPNSPPGETAALSTPRFCRAAPGRAVILACCRKSEFFSPKTPAEYQARLAEMNERAALRVYEFAKKNDYRAEACRFALVDMPLGAVRPHLLSGDIPDNVEAYVRTAFRATIVL